MARLLIIEDDKDLCSSIRDWLEEDGHQVEFVHNGEAGLKQARSNDLDLIILDLNLPGIDGIDICKTLRLEGFGKPIIMLTGRSGLDNKEEGFISGADDYLTKPFNIKELTLRVMALLRRAPLIEKDYLQVGELKAEKAARLAQKKGVDLKLSKLEFDLLWTMMLEPGRVFRNDELVKNAWPDDANPSPAAVRVCVSELRKKLGPEHEPSIIKNIHGIGYKLDI